MKNARVGERFELALDGRQVAVVLLGSLAILGGVFVLGMSVGRQAAPAAPAVVAAPKDALAKLDEPLPVHEEPPPELKAHQVLTGGQAIEKAMPVPTVKTASVPVSIGAPPAVALPAAPPAPAPAPAPAAAAAKPSPPAADAPKPSLVADVPPAPAATTASKTAAAPASKTAAAPRKGAYTIQVGSAPRRSDAERLAKRVAARNPRIVVADVPGKGRWYRVQVGAYDTQDAAKRQLASLSRDGVQGIVTPVH